MILFGIILVWTALYSFFVLFYAFEFVVLFFMGSPFAYSCAVDACFGDLDSVYLHETDRSERKIPSSFAASGDRTHSLVFANQSDGRRKGKYSVGAVCLLCQP